MAGAKEYGADEIEDTKYQLLGPEVVIGGRKVIKHKSPNGFPRYKKIGTSCSGTGCPFFTELEGTAMREAFGKHRRESHASFFDDVTGEILCPVFLYERDPDYTPPPSPAGSHGNKGKRREKKFEE